MICIEADILIPGKGNPIPNGCVITKDDKILYAGPKDNAPNVSVDKTIKEKVVMPGLWDCHAHFMGVTGANFEDMVKNHVVTLAARCVKDAERALMAGFTSIREAGGYGTYIAKAIDEGSIPGPKIYAAGKLLSQTGGHADLHMYPLDWIHNSSLPNKMVDGIPECIKGVREQLRLGAKVIKICVSGGALSQLDHPLYQQFRADEIKAIVDEAARADRIVMAHSHGKEAILCALENGVYSIEHGTFVDEEVCDVMIEKKAILVPTRFVMERLVMAGKTLPDYTQKKINEIADAHFNAMKIAIQKGVTICCGSDIMTSGPNSHIPWGSNGKELAYYVDAGMSPLQAIESATVNGPLCLGKQAPRSGLLQEGYDADIITVSENPLENIKVLGEPNKIIHVIKAGNLVKTN